MNTPGGPTYAYDAEGRVVGVSGNGVSATYLYDPEGNRVETIINGTTRDFIYDVQGNEAGIINISSGATTENYWIGSQKVAVVSGGSTYYIHTTPLGTVRALSGSGGALYGQDASYPFGDGYAPGGANPDDLHFAGLTHDNETGLDHAWARQYSSADGRWMSPDPYLGSYDPANPQTFNRFSYASNAPLTGFDPFGLEDMGDGSDGSAGPQSDQSGSGTMNPGTDVMCGPSGDSPDIGSGGPSSSPGSSNGQGGQSEGPGTSPNGAPNAANAWGISTGGAIPQWSGPGFQSVDLHFSDLYAPTARYSSGGVSLLSPGGSFGVGPNAVALFQSPMAQALSRAFRYLNIQGVRPVINSGYRTPAEQQRMINGASGTNPAAKLSWHEAGMAVDINGTTGHNFPLIRFAMQAQGMTWGGNFTHRDPPHFQLAPAGTKPSLAIVNQLSDLGAQ